MENQDGVPPLHSLSHVQFLYFSICKKIKKIRKRCRVFETNIVCWQSLEISWFSLVILIGNAVQNYCTYFMKLSGWVTHILRLRSCFMIYHSWFQNNIRTNLHVSWMELLFYMESVRSYLRYLSISLSLVAKDFTAMHKNAAFFFKVIVETRMLF